MLSDHYASHPYTGYGLVVNNYIHEVCRCVGISDLYCKVYGSKNPMNVVKATFEALYAQRRPEDIAQARGKRLVDVEKVYYGGGGVASRNAVGGAVKRVL
jgi:ribosomal protein S5